MSNLLGTKENLKFIETFATSIDENDSNLFGLMNTTGSSGNGSSSSSGNGSSSSSASASASSSSSSSRSFESNVQNKLDADRTSTLNEDILDSVLLLRAVVQSKLSSSSSPLQASSSSESSSSELRRYMSTLEQIEQSLQKSSTSCSSLTEVDLLNMNQSLRNIESQLNTTVTDQSTWNEKLPKELLLSNMLGQIDISADCASDVFMIRGKHYLRDKKKIPSSAPVYHCRGVQFIKTEQMSLHVAIQPWCGFPKHYRQFNEWLIVNYMTPWHGTSMINVVCLYTASKEAKDVIINSSSSTSMGCAAAAAAVRTNLSTTATGVMNIPGSAGSESSSSTSSSSSSQLNSNSNENSKCNIFTSPNCVTKKAWALCLHRFYSDTPDGKGKYEYRNNSIKLFPHIVQANWAVQMAIGKNPVLLGKKIETHYFREEGYLEIDINLACSSVARNVFAMMQGISKHMIVDLGIAIEGTQDDELPEAILCHTRFNQVALESAVPVPNNNNSSSK